MIELILGVIFATFGIVILIVGLILYFKKKFKLKNWIETTGKIVGFENKNQDMGYGMNMEIRSPIVEFEGNNDFVSYSNKIYLAKKYVNYKVGDIVPIIYNPIDNYQYYIKSNKTSIYQMETKCIILGIVFTVIGAICPLFLGNISMLGNLFIRRILLFLGFLTVAICVKINNNQK